MARKNIQVSVKNSPDEEKLVFLSLSIAGANNELEEIGKVNKKVLADIEDSKRTLVELQITKDSLHKEIFDIKDKKERYQNAFALVQNNLEEISDKKSKLERELTDFKKDSEDKKNELQSEITLLNQRIEKIKKDYSVDVQSLRLEKENLVKENSMMNSELSILSKKISEQSEKNSNFISICAELSRKKELLNEDVKMLDFEISKRKDLFEKLELKVIEINNYIDEKKIESSKLDISTGDKKKEYEVVSTQLFSITERENALKQKELFIKSQYERAGIKYE